MPHLLTLYITSFDEQSMKNPDQPMKLNSAKVAGIRTQNALATPQRCEYHHGVGKKTIQTSLGPIWAEQQSRVQETRIWWPCGSTVGAQAVTVLEGQARWHPGRKGWYVMADRCDDVLAALAKL
jgi:hypothetical protein